MCAPFKLLAGVLIFVNSPQNGDHLFFFGEGYGAGYVCTGPLGGLDYPLGSLVDQLVVVSFEPDSHLLHFCHVCFSSYAYSNRFSFLIWYGENLQRFRAYFHFCISKAGVYKRASGAKITRWSPRGLPAKCWQFHR